MRKDGKLKKFFIFQMYECAAVEEFLAEMALDGWMVEKIKGSFFTFHKIEPKKLTFAVDIFDKASEFDTIPADSTMEYIEYSRKLDGSIFVLGVNFKCFAVKMKTGFLSILILN